MATISINILPSRKLDTKRREPGYRVIDNLDEELQAVVDDVVTTVRSKHEPLSDEQVNDFAHELWALARKMPNEGIEDCVHRIAKGVKDIEKAVNEGRS